MSAAMPATDFTHLEMLLRDLALHTLAEARRTWGDAPLAGFAFNGSAAWGFLHVSLSFNPQRAAMEPPDWEHECAEDELPNSRTRWRTQYEPLRQRYDAECATHPHHPERFLHTLRRVLAGMERDGVFADTPGIRLLVTEVDADTDAEQAALDAVRRAMGLRA